MSQFFKSWTPLRLLTPDHDRLLPRRASTKDNPDTSSTKSSHSSLLSRISPTKTKLNSELTPDPSLPEEARPHENDYPVQPKENIPPAAITDSLRVSTSTTLSAPELQRFPSTSSISTTTSLPTLLESGTSLSSLGSLHSGDFKFNFSPHPALTRSSSSQALSPRRRRRQGFLGRHVSTHGIEHFHRSISLPPLLECYDASALPNRPGSIRSNSTISTRRPDGGRRLYMNDRDRVGWTKVASEVQIKEIIPTVSCTTSRASSILLDVGGQLDGATESLDRGLTVYIKDPFNKIDRLFRSSDSDRVTRGGSDAPLADKALEDFYVCPTMDEEIEEIGKEPEERDKRGKLRKMIGNAYERARCWVGFRLSGILW